uniref:Uncharacterized protein n=1 Tax=Anguilla anguilla TaxID=7936 RepID=A0A0E9PLN9_ANGAN
MSGVYLACWIVTQKKITQRAQFSTCLLLYCLINYSNKFFKGLQMIEMVLYSRVEMHF